MGTENIVVLRLYSGEMIIGKLNQFSDELSDMQYYELEDPRSIMMVPTMRGNVHIVIKPVCSPFAVKRLEKSLTVQCDQVMFKLDQSEIDKELVNGYKSEISGIKIASAADTMAIATNQRQGGGEFVLE